MRWFLNVLLGICLLDTYSNGQVPAGEVSGSQYTTATWTVEAQSAIGEWFVFGGGTSLIGDSGFGDRESIGEQSFFLGGGKNGTGSKSALLVFNGLLQPGQAISLNANYGLPGGLSKVGLSGSFSSIFSFEQTLDDSLVFSQGTNAVTIFEGAQNRAFTYRAERLSTSSIAVSAGLMGDTTPFFSTNLISSPAPSQLSFYSEGYSGALVPEDYGLFFNTITVVPEPGTRILIFWAGVVAVFLFLKRHLWANKIP